jgi:hypothetical protein
MSGCGSYGGTTASFSGPYADQIFELYENVPVEAKAMLDDGEISDVDIQDFRNLFTKCAKNKGVVITFAGDTQYSYVREDSGTTDDYSREVSDECSVKTGFRDANVLYYEIKYNPENENTVNEDNLNKQLQCLIDNEIYPVNTSLSEFQYDLGLLDGQPHGIYDQISYGSGTFWFEKDEPDGTTKTETIVRPPRDNPPDEKTQKISQYCSLISGNVIGSVDWTFTEGLDLK